MNEIERLQNSDMFLTESQYKKLIIKILILLIAPALISLIGLILMIVASSLSLAKVYIITGLVILIIGCLLLAAAALFVISEYSAQLQTYRRYKKHPESFVLDDDNENKEN